MLVHGSVNLLSGQKNTALILQMYVHMTPPPSAHLRLIFRDHKIFPAAKESYRVYMENCTKELEVHFRPATARMKPSVS